jgi:hypothetical protein
MCASFGALRVPKESLGEADSCSDLAKLTKFYGVTVTFAALAFLRRC